MKVELPFYRSICAVRVDNNYHVKVSLESGNYIHNHRFDSLQDTVKLADKILEIGEIDLKYWKPEDSKDIIHHKFLICKEKRQTKAHFWDGLNTLCTMWNTGGLGRAKGYHLYNTNLGREICWMCTKNSQQD